MRQEKVDLILGLVLLAFSAGWTWIVVATIPSPPGLGLAGPRTFPLGLGVLLGLFSAVLMVGGMTARREASSVAPVSATEARIIGSLFPILIGYTVLLEKIGFLLATPLAVAAVLWAILRLRSWVRIGAVSVALTIGSYVVFELLMKAYLPRGTWFQIV